MSFESSETKKNLVRAFAGESQGKNRYLFAAGQAKKQNLQVLQKVFEYTADQEKAHAKIYYNHLKQVSGSNICIEACYPVDIYDDMIKVLRSSQHNEYQEHDNEYAKFGQIAEQEGFLDIAHSFKSIAAIEKTHGDRFGKFADLMEKNKLFKSDKEEEWLCLNCGHIHNSKDAPEKCPVCHHAQGFFVRKELSPFC